MAKQLVLKDSTSRIEYIWIQDSSSVVGAGKTGLAYNTASLVAYYVRTQGSATAITLATQTVTGAYSSGGFVEVSAANAPGLYRFDVPNAVFATGVDKAVIELSGAANMPPIVLEYQLVGFDPAALSWLTPTVAGRTLDVSATGEAGLDWANIGAPTTAQNLSATNIDVDQVVASVAGAVGSVTGLTAADVGAIKTKTDFLPSATAGAAGGVFIAGTNSATTVTTALTTTFTGNLTGSVGSVTGAVGSVTGAVGSVTGAVGSIASGGIAAASFAAGAINAAAIAADAIGASELAADAVAEIADAVWDEDATGHQTTGTFGQAIGDPVADTNTIYKAVVTDAAGATVAVDVVAVKADTAAILIDTIEIGAAGAGLTNIDLPNQTMNITGNITGNLSGSVGSVTGAVGSVTGAVGSIGSGGIAAATFAAGAIDAAAIATDAIGSAELAASAVAEIRTSILSDVIDGSVVDASPAVGDFDGVSTLTATDDFYNGAVLAFTSGANKGIARKISDFVGSTRNLSFTGATGAADAPFPTAPTNGDTFEILGRIG